MKLMAFSMYLAVLLVVLCPWHVLGQIPCEMPVQFVDDFFSLNTSTSSVNMSCPLPSSAIPSQPELFQWEWLRLGPGNTFQNSITEGITSGEDVSVYTHTVQCTSSGLYQALYRNASTNQCLFSCLFVVSDIRETRPEVLRETFTRYANGTVESNSSEASSIVRNAEDTLPVGLCASPNHVFILPSSCTVQVSEAQWYRNGVQFEPDRQDYIVSAVGELVIRNLTSATAGYYVCVVTVEGLGSYQVVQENIILAPESTEPPLITSSSPAPTTPTVAAPSDNTFGALEAWQFGLIIGVASLVIILILLGGVVWMGRLAVKSRRGNRVQPRSKRGKSHSSNRVKFRTGKQSQPLSMYDEMQLMEAALNQEDVDFETSSSPVEIPFSSILFEELLHKGTFKVVHHGVINHSDQGMLSQHVAVKRLIDEKSDLGYKELMNEAVFLRSFQEKIGLHPNIVSLLGVTTQGGPTCLLLDFVPHGTLEDFLVSLKLGPIPEWYMKFVRETVRGAYHKHVSGDLMNVIMQVADGMKFLTDNGFIHRDLATRNVLIGERLNVKIANPGMHHEGYYYVVSEREHFLQDMAPECLWEKRYSIYSDIWSFGILAYRVVTLNATPFPDTEVDELHSRVVGGVRPQLLASFSNEMYFLLQRCWQFVATERPSFATIGSDLSHMSSKPTRHIILKATKDPSKPGYVSENGQVFLRCLPPQALEEDEAPTKRARRASGTLRSLISSIDDTVYTRETAETVLDFTPSEGENDSYNNYERYLKGELPLLAAVKRRSYEETETSGNDGKHHKKRSSGKKRSHRSVSQERRSENGDVASIGKASGASSGKRRKRRSASNASRDKAQKKLTPSFISKKTRTGSEGSGEGVSVLVDSDVDVSSNAAPSTEEEKDRGISDLSGTEEGSETDLVKL